MIDNVNKVNTELDKIQNEDDNEKDLLQEEDNVKAKS